MNSRGDPPVLVHVTWTPYVWVPGGNGWITPAEREVLSRLHVQKRASDWRLGRWVAKEAVISALGDPSLRRADIEVLASDRGVPQARVLTPGSWPALSLSISHSGGRGLAVAAFGAFRLGCDVEVIEARSDVFLEDYLTEAEQAWVREADDDRDLRANLMWSAKESALKALGEGLRLDTRAVEVTIRPRGAKTWQAFSVATDEGIFEGAWKATGGFVRTVVADRPFQPAERSPD